MREDGPLPFLGVPRALVHIARANDDQVLDIVDSTVELSEFVREIVVQHSLWHAGGYLSGIEKQDLLFLGKLGELIEDRRQAELVIVVGRTGVIRHEPEISSLGVGP